MHFLLHGKTQTVAFGMSQNVCIPVPMHAYLAMSEQGKTQTVTCIHTPICVHTYVSMHFLLHQGAYAWRGIRLSG